LRGEGPPPRRLSSRRGGVPTECPTTLRYAEVSRRSQALLQAEPQVVADFGF
jgi:hypothetical protein